MRRRWPGSRASATPPRRSGAGGILPGTTPPNRMSGCRSSAAIVCWARSSSRTTSASTHSATPTCACCRRSRPAWASRWKTPASSTKRSGCSRRPNSATPSSRSSTACRRRSPPSSTSRASTTRSATRSAKSFINTDMGIRIYDPTTNLDPLSRTSYENGSRISIDSAPLAEQGFGPHVTRTRETLVINENMAQAMEKYGSYRHARHAGREIHRSMVPLVAGDQARGLINLIDMKREHAFSESDVRLLQTLANSMSVALENARLFDETQRLFKESEQRAAELAIINSVQHRPRRAARVSGHHRPRRQQDRRDLRHQGHVDRALRPAAQHDGDAVFPRAWRTLSDRADAAGEGVHRARHPHPPAARDQRGGETARGGVGRAHDRRHERRNGARTATSASRSCRATRREASSRSTATRRTPSATPTCACCRRSRTA